MDSYSNSNSNSYSDSYSCSYSYTYSDFILFPEEAFDTNGIRRDQTREEVEVAEQAHIESSPQHEGSKPLSGEVKQSGNNHNGIDNKCPGTSLFGRDEDENSLKEKYTQEKYSLSTCNPLLTLAATEHKSNTTDTRSVTHKATRDTPLTPSQIDQLLILWGTPELITQHHRIKLLRDLEREDRTVEQTSKAAKRGIYL
ncbi:hypothetical protein KCU93_g9629, partial [Aureobasidium melanogenum]